MQTHRKPLVSICIPNYNNANYLDACIQSALNQTYENIEIIVSDDNSLDASYNICQKYLNKITLLKNSSNIGQPKNTHTCIELCKGKFVVVLHSDDQLLPDFAEKLVPILENNPSVGMAVGERLLTDESGINRRISPFYDMNCIVPGLKQAKVFLMTSFLPCQVLFRKKTYYNSGGIDEQHIINLDGLLWFKFALISDVAYIQDPVGIYRIHKEQTTAKYNRTIDHMLEYYNTLKAMFKIASGIPYLKQYFDEAVTRIGYLTVRYCDDVMKNKDYALAKRFLALANVFDPEIIYNKHYDIIKSSLASNKIEPIEKYKILIDKYQITSRNYSYSPPDGSREIIEMRNIIKNLKHNKIIIYGAGKIGKKISSSLKSYGIEASFFWDNNADKISKLSNELIIKPNIESIPYRGREEYVIILTMFAINTCKTIAKELNMNGFTKIIYDRESINTLIFQACKKDFDNNEFKFILNVCHNCPVQKTNKNTTCDIFKKNIIKKLAKEMNFSQKLSGQLCVRRLGLLISNKCNLRCKACNHLCDIYKPGDAIEFQTSELIAHLTKIIKSVDLINQVVIVGGEPFLHNDLYDIISKVMALPKIGYIQIITNGSIKVKDSRLFNLLSNERIMVTVSGYEKNLSEKLKSNVKTFLSLLDLNEVNYEYIDTLQWFNLGNFDIRPYSHEQHLDVYNSCCFVSYDIFKGKLYKCSRSALATHIGKIPDYKEDYIEIHNYSEDELRAKLFEFFNFEMPKVCLHCDGT